MSEYSDIDILNKFASENSKKDDYSKVAYEHEQRPIPNREDSKSERVGGGYVSSIVSCATSLKETVTSDFGVDRRVPEILQIDHIKRLVHDGEVIVEHNINVGSPLYGRSAESVKESVSSVILSPINSISPPPIIIENKRKKTGGYSYFWNATKELGCEDPTGKYGTAVNVKTGDFFDIYDLKKIGPYVLTKTLGSGSTGKVKLGLHERTGEKIAIKIIPRDTLESKQDEQKVPDTDPLKNKKKKDPLEAILIKEARLLREITLLSLLYHPHIVNLYGYYSTSHYYVLFMENVEGGPLLHHIIQYGKCKEKLSRVFFRQLLSAVNYCHMNGVVHRDLKIENILIDKKGHLKLIDFGLSNFYQYPNDVFVSSEASFGLLHTFCGSLYYAAPELLYGRPYIGPEVDVWSLGVILYILSTGKVPFDDKKVQVLHEKIKGGKVTYPSFLSKPLVSLLESMLTVDPTKRAKMKNLMDDYWVCNDNADSMSKAVALPPINLYFPERQPISSIDKRVVHGIVQALGCRYSYDVVHDSLELVINTWGLHRKHPFVNLYYLIKEKLQRWDLFENEFDLDKEFSEKLDLGLSNFGRKYRFKTLENSNCKRSLSVSDIVLSRLYVKDDHYKRTTMRQENSGGLPTPVDLDNSKTNHWLGYWINIPMQYIIKPFRTWSVTNGGTNIRFHKNKRMMDQADS